MLPEMYYFTFQISTTIFGESFLFPDFSLKVSAVQVKYNVRHIHNVKLSSHVIVKINS